MMAKAKFGGVRNLGGDSSSGSGATGDLDLGSTTGDLTEDILDTDLFLRSFGISDAYSPSQVFQQNQAHITLPGGAGNSYVHNQDASRNPGSTGTHTSGQASGISGTSGTSGTGSSSTTMTCNTFTSVTTTGVPIFSNPVRIVPSMTDNKSVSGFSGAPSRGSIMAAPFAPLSLAAKNEKIDGDTNLTTFYDLLTSSPDKQLRPGVDVHSLEALLQSDLAQLVPVEYSGGSETATNVKDGSILRTNPVFTTLSGQQPTTYSSSEGQPLAFSVPGGQPLAFSVPRGHVSTFNLNGGQASAFIVPEGQPSAFNVAGGQQSAFNVAGGQQSAFNVPGGQASAFTVPRIPNQNSRIGFRSQNSPPAVSTPSSLQLDPGSGTLTSGSSTQPVRVFNVSPNLMINPSTLAPSIQVIDPSTMCPVFSNDAQKSSSVIPPTQIRDGSIMFPTTLEQRTIIKGVRSLNKNNPNNSTSPPGGHTQTSRIVQGEIKQEGHQDTGHMDVDSLGIIQSILSLDSLPNQGCGDTSLATLNLGTLFNHQHQPFQPVEVERHGHGQTFPGNTHNSSGDELGRFNAPFSSAANTNNQMLQGYNDLKQGCSMMTPGGAESMTGTWKKEESSPIGTPRPSPRGTPRPSPRGTPRPSPQSTPPPPSVESSNSRGSDMRSFKRSGRSTPSGKRSLPQTPTNYMSDGEMSDGGSSAIGSYINSERKESGGYSAPSRDTKTINKLEDMEDEDKYNKRKRPGEGGRGKDPIKQMLDELQSKLPHIGNPHEEKVSHAGLLLEGSDYIRSLMRENNTLQENIVAMKSKIEDLNKEIEDSQEQLPEHGSSSIHKIVSVKGKSIPDMYADHVRHRTQDDWRYWVFTSIMGHFVHTFAQEVSNISPREMQRTSLDWLQERMSLQQLRKDAFRKLAKLCSKTSIMEDPLRLPEEARGFVALPTEEGAGGTKEETEELNPPAFRNTY